MGDGSYQQLLCSCDRHTERFRDGTRGAVVQPCSPFPIARNCDDGTLSSPEGDEEVVSAAECLAGIHLEIILLVIGEVLDDEFRTFAYRSRAPGGPKSARSP